MAEKWAVLEFSDGTDRIDLLYGPIRLKSWKPKVAQLKDGGVWGSSPFDSGKRLLDARNYDNVIEEFVISVGAGSQNAVISELQKLRRMLVKASQYESTKWQNSPVWIERRARKETNSTYSLVKTGYASEDNEIFGSPFDDRRGRAVMPEISIFCEREPFWNSNKPGVSSGVAINNIQNTYGRSDTTLKEVYVSNKHVQTILSHVYYYDASGPSWSANLISAILPFSFLPATPAVGDIVYFGSIKNPLLLPFSSLVFDLSQAQANCTIVWEYYNGAWTAFTPDKDNTATTNPFDKTGVNAVYWEQWSDWADTTINGVDALWVRARVTGVGGGPIPPRQQNRAIYTIVTPFVEMAASQVGGDVSARAKIDINGDSGIVMFTNDMLVGLRSCSRGTNYTPYINLGNRGNPSGITISCDTAQSVFFDDMTSPTGKRITYTPAGTIALTKQFSVQIASSLLSEYQGKFHIFLRARQIAGSVGDLRIQLKLARVTTVLWSSEVVKFSAVSAADIETLDFSLVDLSSSDLTGSAWKDTYIQAFVSNSNAANPVSHYFDLIIFPVDEWCFQAVDPGLNGSLTGIYSGATQNTLSIDNITYPKSNRLAYCIENSTQILTKYNPIASNPALLQANAKQRLWFFSRKYSTNKWVSMPDTGFVVQLYKTQRYLGMRGEQ